jgi:formiminoglutamase
MSQAPSTNASGPRPGLAGDRHESGPVWRLKDVVRPFIERPAGRRGEAGRVLVGFACDEGVRRNMGRVGAADGPAAIRRRLARLPAHQAGAIYDAGDVVCVGADLEAAQTALAARVRALIADGFTPIVLGGGHEVAFGSFLGLADALGEDIARRRVGVLNIDAHLDLRRAPERNSGTPFLNIADLMRERGGAFHYLCVGVGVQANTTAMFERADALGVRYWFDDECRAPALAETLAALRGALEGFDDLHLSIDLDALQAALAPGVSAPSPGGMSLEALEAIVDLAEASGKLRVIDVAECNPHFDRDEATAALAARLVWRALFGDAGRRFRQSQR